MKKKKEIVNKIGIIISMLLLVSTVFIVGVITYCNILPIKYLLLFYLLTIIFIGLIILFLIKKKFKIWVKITSIFLSIVIIVIYSFIFFYINRTYNFMDRIKSRNMMTEIYYVVTSNESDYKNIVDLKDKNVGFYDESTEIYDKALMEYNKKVDSKISEYIDMGKMITALLDNNIDAIVVSASYKNIIEEENEDFANKTKILDEIEVKAKYDTKIEHPDIDVSKQSFSIYISGVDMYGDITSRWTSDVNMIATINPNKYEILLTSIPRDYYVQLHGTTGYKDKLTHAGFYGIDMSINTIQDLLDIDIDYYVKVNFTTLTNVVDTIGGIDVYSDKSFTPWTNRKVYIKEGWNHMNGEEALAFSRERKAYSGGDRHRVQNQQDVLSAIIKKMTSSADILTKYTTILDKVSNSLETNVEMSDITDMVKLQLDKMPSWTIKKYNLNGTDCSSNQPTYYFKGKKLWVMYPIEETIQKAHTYIEGVKNNKSFKELGIK